LANIATAPSATVNLDGSITKVGTADRISQGISGTVSGIQQAVSTVGINLYNGNNSGVKGQTTAEQKKIN
jgi:hypothetical protein